jgi:lipopolysaccharide exporter
VLTFKLVNIRGDLFATAFCFATQAVIKLGSSLILTRILNPEAYGVITVLMSIVFVVEMLADIGVTVFVVRDKNAEEPRFLNTAWTLRLGRAILNGAIIFAFGPQIASSFYHIPSLDLPLKVFSLWFIIAGLESMSFPLAIRHKRARIIMYVELTATFLAAIFTVVYCHYSRDYWGILYGALLNRLIVTMCSYGFYKSQRPKFQFDLAAAREMLGLTKFTMPSSILMMAISQFDKIVFLKLFDLRLLGVYGLAGNIAGPLESLISKISQSVLYPRCAHNYRVDPGSVSSKYYTENVKLFISMLILPGAVGGAASLIIGILYPSRYAEAAIVLQAFMLRAALLALYSSAEDLLIAAGESHVMLIGNVYRAIWIFAASLTGFYFFGFIGFTYGVALSNLPPLIYYLWLQHKKGMLIVKYEVYKVAFIVAIAISSYATSSIFRDILLGLQIRN